MKKKSTRDMVMSSGKRQRPVPEPEGLSPERPSISIKASKLALDEPISEPDRVEYVPKVSKRIRAKKEKKERPIWHSPKEMPPIFKSKVFWGSVSLIIAFLLAFVAMPMMESRLNNQLVSVIVAAQDIPEGMKIEGGMLQQKQIRQVDLPSGTLLAGNEAVGKYTSVTVLAGDMLTLAKVGETYFEDAYLYDLPDGKMAMSIELSSLAQSISGKIRGGDVVRIYAVYDTVGTTEAANTGDYSAALIDELQYVEVLAVTNYNVQDISDGGITDGGITEGSTKDSKTIATVTLLVNHQQAVVLAGLSENSTLYAALVVRGDDVKKQAALEAEDRFLLGEVTGAVESEPVESGDVQ